MDNEVMIAIVILVAVAAVLAVWMFVRRRRTVALRQKFGPEYDHVLRSKGTSSEAERELLEREKRVSSFALRPLSPDDAEQFSGSWRTVQARFVDDPRTAVVDADRLIGEVMRARGYPVEDPHRRLDDLSVEHAHVVNHYRDANVIMARHERGEASTEDLRQAMVHFRALFEEMVSAPHRMTRRAS